ncbi:MAG: M28 family peptidase, partial [Planctomycetia bacterium]|nr:M28 family peptidase [Planctomycetia bacterium]
MVGLATLWLGVAHCDVRADEPPAAATAFSGSAALAHLERIVALGPRPSGSAAMVRQRHLLTEHFRGGGGTVTGQPFRTRDPRTGQPVEMENLIVEWHPQRVERILVAAHYDTRPYPDRDPVDPRGTFVGANDGASGVAVLMELARAMPALDGPLGVDFVLFDAEEYVVAPRDPYFLGSKFFAREYVAAGNFLWNGGIFVWKAATILAALAERQPECLAHLRRIAAAWDTPARDRTFAEEFAAIKGISIDYAVLEHARDVVVIEAPFTWDDLGGWAAVARQRGADADGNTIVGRHLGLDSVRTIVHSDGDHLVVTMGLEDMLVVHTPDATLVAHR